MIAPSLRAISDVPGFTLEQKNSRAADAWAVITNVDPCDAYSLMLYGHAFVLNELCADAGHDALTEAKSGIMPGTESPMKWRAMSAYGTMHRSLCQNVNAFLRVRKELTPSPPAPPGGRKRTAKEPATEPRTGPMEPAWQPPPGAEDNGTAGRDATEASAHSAAASFIVKPGAADDARSDSGIVTKHEQNTASAPDVARPAPPVISRSGATKQPPNAGDTLSATNSLHPAPVDTGPNQPRPISTQPPGVPAPPPLAVPAPPTLAVPTPLPPADARWHAAGVTPRRIRDGPRTKFSRRRSS